MMAKRHPQCLECKHADWQRTASGKLHPSGDGRCRWEYPEISLPVSMYFVSFGKGPSPSGGHINRRHEWRDCPQFQPISQEQPK